MVPKKAKDVRTIGLRDDLEHDGVSLARARRTAFVARFIVLREAKRTRAHRRIEKLAWENHTSAEDLAALIREIFIENGDNMESVDRDLNRAMAHASRSISFFIDEYLSRSTVTFVDALFDYEASNQLLFGFDEQPKPGGWLLPSDLKREAGQKKSNSSKKPP
jgi:hypothetical protein